MNVRTVLKCQVALLESALASDDGIENGSI